MQSKEYLKIKARKIAKQTWAGPGKFGVFIVICIIIIATFESLGLSNREKNLELRNVPLVAVQLNLKNIEEGVESKTSDTILSNSKQIKDMEFNSDFQNQMILSAAVDQYLYESLSSTDSFDEDLSDRQGREYNVVSIQKDSSINKSGKIIKESKKNSTNLYNTNTEENISYSINDDEEDKELDLAFFDI